LFKERMNTGHSRRFGETALSPIDSISFETVAPWREGKAIKWGQHDSKFY